MTVSSRISPSRPDLPSSLPGSPSLPLTQKALRAWAASAREYARQAEERERILAAGFPGGAGPLAAQAAGFRRQEAAVRRAFADRLDGCPLPPREWDVLRRHYLGYQSWSAMAEDTGYSRRYLLLLHARGMQRLLEWTQRQKGHAGGASR
ncbi:MAG TPA: hypothetical protein H9684_09150 [Firmicutes bacterium]|nr:hypothetical protein [Bacillota bacterium]